MFGNNEYNEAVVVACKCGKAHKTFGIRAEKTGLNSWEFTWAFPINEAAAAREGYDKSHVSGNVGFSREYPGCPYCGSTGWMVCPKGHLTCNSTQEGTATCEWCGFTGRVSAYTGERINAGMDL